MNFIVSDSANYAYLRTNNIACCVSSYDDVMTWDRFPHYRPYVKGIRCLSVDSPHEEPVMQIFVVSCFVNPNKVLSKQMSYQWV